MIHPIDRVSHWEDEHRWHCSLNTDCSFSQLKKWCAICSSPSYNILCPQMIANNHPLASIRGEFWHSPNPHSVVPRPLCRERRPLFWLTSQLRQRTTGYERHNLLHHLLSGRRQILSNWWPEFSSANNQEKANLTLMPIPSTWRTLLI